MGALQALSTAGDTVRRNPVLFVVAAAFSLLQIPGLVAQTINPLLGSIVSLVFSGLLIFIVPFFFGGIIGMANEAIGGRTSIDTLVSEGKSHYVSLLVTYFGLLLLNLLLGFVGVFVLVFGGAFVLSSSSQPGITPFAVLGVLGLGVFLIYFVVLFFVQFFGHAIVIDDLQAVDGLKRSVSVVRQNLLSALGYTILVSIGGGVMGLLGAAYSVLTTPSVSESAATPAVPASPLGVPSVGIVGTVVFLVLLVVLSGLFGGFFAAYSTAFYRSIRPTQSAGLTESI
ncbi:hypothetical protein ACFQJC_06135 [Haloferax namakaokahaiae]|uniref:DUF7847 domain-containing protein n=1 Tax=Haloferax namakaokahaiae TaxID=1748331 RepID=A0ABD5ZCX3_9EURY